MLSLIRVLSFYTALSHKPKLRRPDSPLFAYDPKPAIAIHQRFDAIAQETHASKNLKIPEFSHQ